MTAARTVSAKTPDQSQWRTRVLAWANSGGAGVSLAARFGLDTLIRRLVDECGQNVFAKNVFGNSALHEASIRGFESTAQLLISKCSWYLFPGRSRVRGVFLPLLSLLS